jgi:hypothetical protein
MPPGGLTTDDALAGRPDVHVIKRVGLFPGPDPSTYAFQQTVVQRNIYRLPLD